MSCDRELENHLNLLNNPFAGRRIVVKGFWEVV